MEREFALYWLQMDFIQSSYGGVVMAVAWSLAYIGALLWARQPNRRDRWLVVAAATCMGVIVFIVNQIAHAVGWWGWWGYALPLIAQAGLLLLGTSVFFTSLLEGYRWLVSHSQHPLRTYGLIMIVILVPLTVLGDLYGLQRGKLSFGGGYTLWQDMLIGQVFAWLPILLYRGIAHRYQTSLSTHKGSNMERKDSLP